VDDLTICLLMVACDLDSLLAHRSHCWRASPGGKRWRIARRRVSAPPAWLLSRSCRQRATDTNWRHYRESGATTPKCRRPPCYLVTCGRETQISGAPMWPPPSRVFLLHKVRRAIATAMPCLLVIAILVW